MVDTVKYVVAQDDSLWNIMKKNGFPPQDWEKALNASYNAAFKNKLSKENRSPNLIFKGEEFYLPEYNPAQIQDLILQLDSKYDIVRAYQDKTDRLTSTVSKFSDDKKKTQVLLKQAKDTIREMNKADKELAEPAPGDPKGGLDFAKLVKQLTDKNRKEVEKNIDDLEKNLEVLDSKETKAAVQKITKLSKEVSTGLDDVEKEVTKIRDVLSRNMQNPY